MTVKTITDKDLWDRFVDDSPYGLIFHKWDFLKIMEKYSGYKLMTYGIYKGNELVGVFPAFHTKQMGMSFVFSPPPGLGVPYLGPVMGRTYEAVKQRRRESYLTAAAEEIDAEFRKKSPRFISILTVPGLEDIRPFLWSGYGSDLNYTYVIDLCMPIEEVWKRLDDNCKKSIRHGDRYKFRMEETTDIGRFYETMTARYSQQKLNYPVVSVEYLSDVLRTYPENIRMYFLYLEDKLVGIELTCRYKDRFMLWMGESVIQRDVPANYYMRWELIKMAKEEGFRKFEIEGANTKHLCLNKSRFNPTLSQGYCLYKKDALGSFAEWTYRNMVKRHIGT